MLPGYSSRLPCLYPIPPTDARQTRTDRRTQHARPAHHLAPVYCSVTLRQKNTAKSVEQNVVAPAADLQRVMGRRRAGELARRPRGGSWVAGDPSASRSGRGRSRDHRPPAGCSALVDAGGDPRRSARPPALWSEPYVVEIKTQSVTPSGGPGLQSSPRILPAAQAPIASRHLHYSIAEDTPAWACAAPSARTRTAKRHPLTGWAQQSRALVPRGAPLGAMQQRSISSTLTLGGGRATRSAIAFGAFPRNRCLRRTMHGATWTCADTVCSRPVSGGAPK